MAAVAWREPEINLGGNLLSIIIFPIGNQPRSKPFKSYIKVVRPKLYWPGLASEARLVKLQNLGCFQQDFSIGACRL